MAFSGLRSVRRARQALRTFSGPLHAPQRYFAGPRTHGLRHVSAFFAGSITVALIAFLLAAHQLSSSPLTGPQALQLAALALPLLGLQIMIGSLTLFRFTGDLRKTLQSVLWSMTPLGIVGVLAASLASVDLAMGVAFALLAAPIWAIAIIAGALRAWRTVNLRTALLTYLGVVYVAPNALLMTMFALTTRLS